MISSDLIKLDMYSAMKSGDKERVLALRTLLAKLKDYQIKKQEDLTEQDCINVIKSMVKQRKEAAEMYQNANRNKLAEKEKFEIKILNKYLPKIMSKDEHRELVKKVVKEIDANSLSDMGKAMSLIIERGGNVINGSTANKILRELLE